MQVNQSNQTNKSNNSISKPEGEESGEVERRLVKEGEKGVREQVERMGENREAGERNKVGGSGKNSTAPYLTSSAGMDDTALYLTSSAGVDDAAQCLTSSAGIDDKAPCFTSGAMTDGVMTPGIQTGNVTLPTLEVRVVPFDRAPTEPWAEEVIVDPAQLVEVEMLSQETQGDQQSQSCREAQDDACSVASTSCSSVVATRSKRKMDVDLSEGEGQTTAIKDRLRSHKVRVVAKARQNTQGVMDQSAIDQHNSKETTQPTGAGATPLPKDSDDLSGLLTASETDEGRRGEARSHKKKTKKGKRAGPTIESQLREIPASLEELAITPASQLGASALEWLEDIEVIRIGSGNLQGGLQSQMKKRVTTLKEVVRVMTEKIEDVGDPGYLRRRNAELAAELKISKRETEQLRRDFGDLQKVVENLKVQIKMQGDTMYRLTADKAVSPLPSGSRDRTPNRINRMSVERRSISRPPVEDGIVMRPSVGGVSVPVPTPPGSLPLTKKE